MAEIVEHVSKTYTNVHVGSYPMLSDSYKVKITLESEDDVNLTHAYTLLVGNLPKESIVSVEKCSPNSRGSQLRSGKRNNSISQSKSFI